MCHQKNPLGMEFQSGFVLSMHWPGHTQRFRLGSGTCVRRGAFFLVALDDASQDLLDAVVKRAHRLLVWDLVQHCLIINIHLAPVVFLVSLLAMFLPMFRCQWQSLPAQTALAPDPSGAQWGWGCYNGALSAMVRLRSFIKSP